METWHKVRGKLPRPERVQSLLIWHQGALGDLLLAGPAFQALCRHYGGAAIIGAGQPERWELFQETLGLARVWDAGAGLWAWLYAGAGSLPPLLAECLSGLSLALIFRPRRDDHLLERLQQAGVAEVAWTPSFAEDGREPVRLLQARHLTQLGLAYEPEPFHLALDAPDDPQVGLPSDRPLLTVAPGSGHPKKNWPLSHYFELTRTLAWEYRLHPVWLAGPAEAAWLPYVRGLAEAQGHTLLANLSLRSVARVLARSHLHIGGDSGITHLAAAAGARRVLALFGPTDPLVWAPFGDNVTVATGPGECTPCAAGREIACQKPHCLTDLAPAEVLEMAAALLDHR
jgi:heptosyltransferase III